MNKTVKLTKQRADKMKQLQKVSCLYSEYIYRTSPKSSICSAELQKFKELYEQEKFQHNKLKQSNLICESQKKKLLQERKMLQFAIDSLMIKITSQQEKSQAQHDFEQKSNSRQDQEHYSSSNLSLTSSKASQKKTCKSFRKKKKKNQEESGKENKYTSNKQKLQALKILKYKIKENQEEIKNPTPPILGKTIGLTYDNSLRFENQKQINDLKSEVAGLESKNQINMARIGELQKQIIERKQQNQILNQNLAQKCKLEQQLRKKCETLMNSKDQIFQIQRQLQQKFEDMQRRNKFLETRMKVTEQEYRCRQQKQKQCVQILQKFTKQLEINDQKISEFLTHEVGFDQSDVKELQRSRKTYQEYISYILHICKKKDIIYNSMVQQFKQKLLESELKLVYMEKRSVSLKSANTKLISYVNNIRQLEENSEYKLRSLLNFIRNI